MTTVANTLDIFYKVQALFNRNHTLPDIETKDIKRINLNDFTDIRFRVNNKDCYYIIDIDPNSHRIVKFIKCYDLLDYALSVAIRDN